MPNYNIALPTALRQLFTYRSQQELQRGCRVVVSFGSRLATGVVWGEYTDEPPADLKLRDVLEVIDEEPLAPPDLPDLAQWMANYYRASVGACFFAMLPGGLNVLHQREARLAARKLPQGCDQEATLLFHTLSALHWTDLADLKSLRLTGLHARLERLEALGAVELRRSYDVRLKNRVVNWAVLQPASVPEGLAEKQQAVLEMLKGSGEMPLARLAEQVGYGVVKTLRKKGLVSVEPREEAEHDEDIAAPVIPYRAVTLTDEQQTALAAMQGAIAAGQYATFLLHGITGSGKTELYIEAIRQVRAQGQTALLLVPEISLTPQLMGRFYGAFGDDVAVLHSHLSQRQRLSEWRKLAQGRAHIVLGARSAIFAPLRGLGVVIVDEEHETSYKQDSTPRYNARDIALVRARIHGCPVVLGSATPSLESWQNAVEQRFSLLTLRSRPLAVSLPEVAVLDLRGKEQLLTEPLQQRIEDTLKRGEQVLLFLNRRGHASHVQCISCGKLFKCPHCDISLSYHSHGDSLVCHYCGHTQPLPHRCPDCGQPRYSFGFPGTQQIEQQLRVVFPQAGILRMDSDTTGGRDSYTSMFERMRSGAVDILLGTQMIAKGLDFEKVSLVGVISADVSLNLPDFRAAERTFQLLTQVAGRAGRRERTGSVLIQTYNPEHYAVRYACRQDYESFAAYELDLRRQYFYPPFSRLARVLVAHKNEKYLAGVMGENREALAALRQRYTPQEVQVLGPMPAPFTKLYDSYRQHIVVKAASPSLLSQAVKTLLAALRLPAACKVTVDIDPGSLL